MQTPIPPQVVPPEDPALEPDAPMTEVQAVQLRELTGRLGLEFDAALTQAQAEERIRALEELQGE